MTRYVSQQEAKDIDAALLKLGYDLGSLIEVAGLVVFEVIMKIFDEEKNSPKNILVLCGPGNNGSDGLVISRYLRLSGLNVTVFSTKLKHENLVRIAESVGVIFTTSDVGDCSRYDCVIDSLFGFSFRSPLREPFSNVIKNIRFHKNVISIDVPSGYDIDKEEDNDFVPRHVISLVAPKICTKRCNSVYITRCFVPKQIYDDENDYVKCKKAS